MPVGRTGAGIAQARHGRPRGRRAARRGGREADYELLVEAIREGYLLHYAPGRVVRPDDPDLALLAGDRLYALGLARLAALGDLEAVAELADVISLGAQAHAAGDAELAEAVWEAGARAVGWGHPELDAQGTRPRRRSVVGAGPASRERRRPRDLAPER